MVYVAHNLGYILRYGMIFLTYNHCTIAHPTVITEWAACGIACAILPFYTGLQLVKVTESGDRFDYWIGDGQQLYGLEISGLLHGRLEPRQRMKARQLLDNPFGISGYVCIVHFDQQRVNLSFHRQ